MNIFKFIKDTITKLAQNEDEETIIRIGNGHISLDKDMGYDGYCTVLDIPIKDNDDKKNSVSLNSTNNDRYYCVASSVVNVGNIFGGIYAASFVVKEDSEQNSLKLHLEEAKEEPDDNILDKITSMIQAGITRSAMMPATPVTVIWDVSIGSESKNAYIVVRYLNAAKYNKIIGSDTIDIRKTLIELLVSNRKSFQSVSMPDNVVDAVLNGFIYAINHGYDGTLVDSDDEEKINQTYRIPTICQFGDKKNVNIMNEFCNGFLEIERLIIGKTIKDVCGLSYIPEIADCMWTDVPYFEKIKKKYKKMFESPRIKEIAKLNILKLLEE